MIPNDIKILDRHKSNISCDLCRNTIYFWQKALRCVVSKKDNIWSEYYHVKCLEKAGILRKLKKEEQKDNKDKDGTSNLVH